MTKQQAISLHLAKWLYGADKAMFNEHAVSVLVVDLAREDRIYEFTPFAATTEGRAQFAECVIKAAFRGWLEGLPWADSMDEIVPIFLEAIYLATGGQPGQWEES